MTRTANIFLAAYPNFVAATQIESLATQLRVAHRFSAAPLAAARFHISLINITGAFATDADAMEKVAKAQLRGGFEPFDVNFDRVDSFRGARRRNPLVLLPDAASRERLGCFQNALCDARQRHEGGRL